MIAAIHGILEQGFLLRPDQVAGLKLWHDAAQGITLNFEGVTTTTADVAAGATVIPITSNAGLFQWSKIKIGAEERTINLLGGNSITINSPLANAYVSGTSIQRGRVSQWNDLSGNNNHYTQVTLNSQPFYLTRAFGQKPAIKMQTHYMATPSVTMTDRTYVEIFQLIGTSPGTYHGITLQNTSPYYQLQVESSSTLPQKVRNVINSTNYDMDHTLANTIPVMIVNTIGAGQAQVIKNGVAGTLKTGVSNLANTGPFWVGAAVNFNNGNANAEFSEKLVYDRVLSPGEIAGLQDYYKNKYGFTF